MLWQCFYPTLQQAVAIGLSVVGPCILLRLLVLFSGLQQRALNVIATVLGLSVLWWYYKTSIVYFCGICVITYALLACVGRGRGAVVSIACIAYILSWYVYTPVYSGVFLCASNQLNFLFTVSCSLHPKKNGTESEVTVIIL